MELIDRFKIFITKGNERSIKAKKNILTMFLYKGGNIAIGLLLVPMTIKYVDSENYGIWLTLSSMVAWMSFFNIGLNNGLKNKLGEAFALGDLNLGKRYVSTTYAILCLIFIPLMLILLFICPHISWFPLLNISPSLGNNLIVAICILIVYFCLNFILSTINIIIQAEQRPADASMRDFIQQLATLLVILILTLTTQGSLLKLCVALCAAPIVVITIFNVTLFKGRYRNISPSFHSVDFKLAPSLLNLGVKFFIIQIAGVIQYQMCNFLILRYYGASEVTSYNIAYKYFSILLMSWSILTTPIWSAVTDAMIKKDYTWISNVQKRYIQIFILFAIGGCFMLAISSWIYHIWIGDAVVVTFVLSAFVLIYNLVMMLGNIFVSILNGSGILGLQMYACLISPFVFIGVFMLCSKVLDLGILSILIASILSNFNGFLLAPIQCTRFLRNAKLGK